MKTMKLMVLMAALVAPVCGCKSAMLDTLYPVSRVTVTNTVTVLATNTIAETVYQTNEVLVFVTNAVTGVIVTNAQTQIQPVVLLKPVIVTNQVPVAVEVEQRDSARIEAGTKAVGAVVSGLGVPYAGGIAAGAAFLAHLLTAFFNRRKISEAQNNHGVALDAAQTLVENIDAIRRTLAETIPAYGTKGPDGRSIDDKVVQYLTLAQTAVSPEVKALIEDLLDGHKDNVKAAQTLVSKVV